MQRKMESVAHFLAAAETGNIGVLKNLLNVASSNGSRDYLISARDKDGNTALHIAADKGMLNVIKYLIEQKATIDVLDKHGMTPVQCAAKAGHLVIVKYFVDEQKVDLNTQDDLGMTALAWAVKSGNFDVVEYLSRQGSDINVLDKENMSPVQHAVQLTEWNVARYLVVQGADVNVPDKGGITVLQRVIKAGKWDLVKYLIGMGADVNVLDGNGVAPVQCAVAANEWAVAQYMVEKGGKIESLTSEQKGTLLENVIGPTIDTHNAFYNVIRLDNSELLEMLIRKKELDDSNNPDTALKLDNVLAQTYEELKIKNVPLSPEIEFEVETKLIGLRFFTDKNDKNDEVVTASLSGVKKRVEMVCDQIGKLNQGYSGGEGKEVDGEFLLVSRFVAQNIRILKRQLKSTYYTLPWEEMEFCLSIFISIFTHQDVYYLYKLVLDKERILTHLRYFAEKLDEEKSNLRDEDVNSKFPEKIDTNLSARNDAVGSVISSYSLFQELYSDYELIKNVYSLKRIESYIKLALSINFDEENEKDTVKLVVERTLQVIGESLKNSLESPNVSDDIHQMLLYSAPRNVREIITLLRDSLSHAHTLRKRIDFENNDEPRFFGQIQNDLRKIYVEITDILYKKNIEVISVFLNKIIKSKNLMEIKKLCKSLFGTEFEKIRLGNSNTKELEKTKELIEELDAEIKDHLGLENEQDILSAIRAIVYSQEDRPTNVKSHFSTGLDALTITIGQVNQNMLHDIDSIKNIALTFLESLKPQMQIETRQEILTYVEEMYNSVEQKMQSSKSNKIKKLLYSIKCTVEFEASRIKGIHTLRERLEKKESVSQSEALDKMKTILDEIKKGLVEEPVRKIFKETLKTRKKIYRTKQNLVTLFGDLDEGLINKDEASVNQNYNDLVNALEMKTNKKDELNERFSNADWKECKNIINNLDDKYQTLLRSITNSLNTDKSTDLSTSFKRFFSAKKLNVAIDHVLKTNKDQFQSYYEERLTKLNKLFATNSGSQGNALDLVSKYKNDKRFQSSLDMLVLDLTDILKNESLFGDNKLYLDGYSAVLVGKPLRNYLAHGDAFIDTVPYDLSTALISNAILLIKANTALVAKKSLLVGQRIEEAFDNLNIHYNHSLDLITRQIEMYVAAKEGSVQKVKYCVDKGVDITSRDVKGWTGMHYAAQGDSVDVVKYFLDQNIGIEIEDIYGKNVLHVAATHKSNNVIKYLITEYKVNVNSIGYEKKTLLHYVSEIGTSKEVVRFLLDEGAQVDARDDDDWTPLHFSALGGQQDVTIALLKQGATVNARDHIGSTPLYFASFRGHQNVVEVLLKSGAKVNARDEDDWTPLHVAAVGGHQNVAKTLLDNRAHVDAREMADRTPLHLAAFGGKLGFVEVLLMKGANINAVNEDSMTPLHVAVQFGQKDVTLTLLKNGVNVNVLNVNKETPIHLAVIGGHLDVVKILLEKRYKVDPLNNDHLGTEYQNTIAKKETNIEILNKNKCTPLYLAAEHGHRDILKELLKNGANIEAENKEGFTPLHIAALKSHLHVVHILLQNGATVHTKNVFGFTPLHSAAISGKIDIVLALLKNGSSVDERDNGSLTPLHQAVKRGRRGVVIALLDSGAKVNAHNKEFVTPLHMAAKYGHKEIAEVLISQNADIEALIIDNSTPLHIAAYYGQDNVVRVLLKEKAKVDAVYDSNMTPLHLAAQNGYSDVARLLLEKKADVNALGKDSRTPLHLATQNGHLDVTMVLLDSGAKINAFDKINSRPLHLAVEKSHIEVVEALLGNGADVNAENMNGITPLHVAAFNGYKDIVQVLLENRAVVNSLDKDDRTPLHFSAFAGHKDVAKVILDGKGNVDSRDSNNMTPLHMAAEYGSNDVAMVLLDYGAEVNASGEDNRSPLHLAALNAKQDVVSTLLERGAIVDALDKEEMTPLHLAVENGNTDICVVLLDNGADFLARNYHDSVLHRAVNGKNEEILILVLHKIKEKFNNDAENLYYSINAQDAEFDTPLMWAAKTGNVDAAKILLEYGADIDAENNDGRAALHYATENAHLEIVQILIENKANTNKEDKAGKTPYDLAQERSSHSTGDHEKFEMIMALLQSVTGEFNLMLPPLPEQEQQVQHRPMPNKMSLLHIAALNGKLSAVNEFLEKGADVNTPDDSNMTPLHFAARNGHRDIVDALLKKKANINARNKSGWTPLHFAVSRSHKDVIDSLLENTADINAQDNDELTPLHIASVVGQKDIVKSLLKNEANINIRTGDNLTPLHFAADNGQTEIVNVLLKNGANIDDQGKDKMTALHYAAEKGHHDLVKALLRKDGNSEARAKNNWTPLHYAAANGHQNVVEVLSGNGANIHSRAKYGMRALHYAAANGHRSVVEVLLGNEADIEALTRDNNTALHYAAANGRKDVLKALLDKGANVNAQTKDGMTPLHYAANYGHRDLVITLLERGADFTLKESHQETAEDLATKQRHLDTMNLLRNFKAGLESRQELEVLTKTLSVLQTEQENVGLEPFGSPSSGPSCSWQYRKKRNVRHCADEESKGVFPYEPLEESVSVEVAHCAKIYTQVTMGVAVKHSSQYLNGDINAALDSIITYNNNIGDIISEQTTNHSPREHHILGDYYENAQEFFKDYPVTTVLNQVEKISNVAKNTNSVTESWLFENGQHTMFMFKDGNRYQLYSTDFNYRHRFRTREDLSFDEAERFIKSFFQWRSGTSKYKTFTLKESLPEKLLEKLQHSPFWFPDKVVPDGILLTNEHFDRIESLPAKIVREIFFVSGQTPDVAALHSDFFQQHKGKLSLRVEMLHKKLPSLTEGDIQALLMIVRKYDCPIDETYLNDVSAAERALLESYHSRVALELKTAATISSKQLSELSWAALNEGLAKHPDISAELTEKVMTATKELHATATKGAWVKGMATQTLFFLPDIIRATNTGDVTSLAQTGGMLTADATINNLYTGLINNLETVIPEGRLRLLRALPVTSPVFKALTVYSIVELTKQLRTLPPSSETRGIIEHKLGEQYMTAGLMVAELLGFEVTPLWIGLIAEQLIFDADTFRKQNHLDVPFWEALLMSLGFEQEKLHAIIEERQLVDVILSLVNKLNSQATIPYGWVIVKIPRLGEFKWVVVSQDQVPGEIRRKINSIKVDYSRTSAEQVLTSDGYRLVNKYKLRTYSAYSTVVVTRGKLITSYWQKGIYDADPKNVTVDFSLHHNDRQSFQREDNVFLDQVLVENVNYRRIPSLVGGRFLNGFDPIKRDVFGAAVYVNNQTSLDTRAQSSFYVGFDPREGDLGVDFTAEGLEKIDDMNVIHNLGVSSSSTYDSFNASSAYIVTVQVGFKPYPSAIEFSKQAGVFSLTDSSRRVVSQYLITDLIDYVIKDLTSVTRIVLSVGSSGKQYGEANSTYNTIGNDEAGAIKIKNWQCTKSIINGKNEYQKLKVINQGSISLSGNKKYLQLRLNDHVIEKQLRVSAEHVDILEAKGEVVNPSMIDLGEEVASFNITITGDIVINNGATTLQITGKVPDKLSSIVYSKAAHNKVISLYELTVNDALRPIMETMSRSNTTQHGKKILDIHFSISEVEYMWLNKLPQDNLLKIEGTLDGKVAFLKVEANRDTLNIFAGDNQLGHVEIAHYDERGTVDKGFILKEIISKLASTSKGSYQKLEDSLNNSDLITSSIKSSNARSDILVFQSPDGYDVYHWFPSSNIIVNYISYIVKGKVLCAVYGEGGVIDGRELINSGIYISQAKFSKSPIVVGVCFVQSMKDSKIFVQNNTLVINDLTLHHLSDGARIYFNEQAYPVRALRDNLVSNQSKVTGSIQHVHRRSLPGSNVEHGREYVVDLNNTSSSFEQSEVSSIIFSNIRPGKLKVAARNNDLVLSVSGSVHTLTIQNWNDKTGRTSETGDLQTSLVLKFRYARQVTEVAGVNRFELSEIDQIQTLMQIADVNYQISQQLEQLDADIVNGLRYIFATGTVECYHCSGYKTVEDQQLFLASYNNHFDKDEQKRFLNHHQTIPALIWSVSKSYGDYLLRNPNRKKSELLADIVDSCFDVVLDEEMIHRLVKCLEDDDVVGEVGRFIKDNSQGLLAKVEGYLSNEKQSLGFVMTGNPCPRFVNDATSKCETNTAPYLRSSINNVFNWIKDKASFLASNIINLGQTNHNQRNAWCAIGNMEDLKSPIEEAPFSSSSFRNLANSSLFNLNGTLLFADFLIRKYTKVKPCESKYQPITLIEAQAFALNITTEFEALLEELSEELTISRELLEFNPITIQNKVIGEFINGHCSRLSKILLESIDCSHLAGRDTEFLNRLKDKIDDMLIRRHAGIAQIEESGGSKEGWMINKKYYEENLKTTLELRFRDVPKIGREYLPLTVTTRSVK